MQISSIRNQNFCAKLCGDYKKIAEKSIQKGLPEETAHEIFSELENDLPEDYIITFKEPQPYSVEGRVFVENSRGSGVDVVVSPVLYNKDTLFRYAEAAKALAEIDFSRNRGLRSID